MARFRLARRQMPADMRRAVAVAVLLAVAAVGLRSGGAFSSAGIPAAARVAGRAADVGFGILEGIGALACIAVLVFLSRLRYRKRSPEDDFVQPEPWFPWWVRPLALLTALALLAVPAVLLVITARGHPGRSAAPAGRIRSAVGRATAHATVAHAVHASSGSGISWWLLGGMAAAGAAAVAVALSTRRRPSAESEAAAGHVPAAPALVAAAAAGTAALYGPGDARAAIIACYAAMEHSLARAGAAPAVSDTPGEVLARASAGGLVRSAPAQALTELFRRARYSTHHMDETDRAAALGALGEIRADLPGPGRLPAGSVAGSGA
jgi:Domain of unknown function (DUF4129)